MLWYQSIIHRFIQTNKLFSIIYDRVDLRKLKVILNVLQLFYQVW